VTLRLSRIKALLLLLVFAAGGGSASGEEAILVEAAKQVTAYWEARFGRCEGQAGKAGAWYARSADRTGESIQMVPELRIQFRTEELSEEEKLNGVELRATSTLSPGAFRWWIPEQKAWRDWQFGEIAPPIVVVRKKGAWSVNVVPGRFHNREALTNCSQIPPD
jgi:hypothetical protein